MVALNRNNGVSYISLYFYPDHNFVDISGSWEINLRQTPLNLVFDMIDDGHALLFNVLNIYRI